MAIVSVRFNKQEEKILDYLSESLEEDRSTLIKYSLRELYEDLADKKFIEDFEKKESKTGKTKFTSGLELRKELERK